MLNVLCILNIVTAILLRKQKVIPLLQVELTAHVNLRNTRPFSKSASQSAIGSSWHFSNHDYKCNYKPDQNHGRDAQFQSKRSDQVLDLVIE